MHISHSLEILQEQNYANYSSNYGLLGVLWQYAVKLFSWASRSLNANIASFINALIFPSIDAFEWQYCRYITIDTLSFKAAYSALYSRLQRHTGAPSKDLEGYNASFTKSET